jgi:hypothetical protein
MSRRGGCHRCSRPPGLPGPPYLIEHKHFRRTPQRDLPTEICETETFELHGVMFETAALNAIEIPQMTIREHIDISMQLHRMGRIQVVDPRSVVEFDNLGTRAELGDLAYFDLRWNRRILEASSAQFFERWGLRFYNEQFMYNWAVRRRLFTRAAPFRGAGVGREQGGECVPEVLPDAVGAAPRPNRRLGALLLLAALGPPADGGRPRLTPSAGPRGPG